MNGGLYPALHRPIAVQKALGTPVLGALVARAFNERGFGRSMRRIFGDDHQPTDAELHELWLGIARRDGHRIPHLLIRYIDERRENADAWSAALERTDRPLAFVWGEADPISGAHMLDEVRRRLPRARIESRPDVGHYPQLEDPAWVAGALRDFL
jgi:pimeloyl-ACP methyl ester carboxylesterase